MGVVSDPFAPAASNSSTSDRNQPTNPPSAKWIQNNDNDGEADQVGLVAHNRGYKLLNNWAATDSQFGGNKLRAPRTLANEEEYILGDKKRTVVKRRRRDLDEELSDAEEDDPYRQINIEDILSPIEYPTDIVHRPALKRIIKSPQIEELAHTAMEFIEGEKNFCKILSRLSAILHRDDPQYLDVTFERSPEQRKAAQPAQEKLQNGRASPSKQDADEPMVKPEEGEEQQQQQQQQDEGPDTEAQEVVRTVRELLLENINFSNEYLSRLQGARDKLTKASMQKEALWTQLKVNAKKEQDRSRRVVRHA